MQDLRKVTNDCVRELRRVFRNGIQKRCDVGANKAKQAAVDTSDSFARRLSWQGYRAGAYCDSQMIYSSKPI